MIHKVLLWIHIPVGTLALFLFWIPVGLQKGSPLHKKIGWYYFIAMWAVVITAILMSICNVIMAKYMSAVFLGYLAIITAYPLWYAYEILKQGKVWTKRYFTIRKIFVSLMCVSGIGLFLLGAIKFRFAGFGTMMVFFGIIGILSGRDIFMSLEKAMDKEKKMSMHIQGTIISGIAAYTAFFAFGGNHLLMGVLKLSQQWLMVPWIGPTVLGVIYMRYMKKKYRVA